MLLGRLVLVLVLFESMVVGVRLLGRRLLGLRSEMGRLRSLGWGRLWEWRLRRGHRLLGRRRRLGWRQ